VYYAKESEDNHLTKLICDQEFISRLVKNIALQFGDNCEVVLHEFDGDELKITQIENGHVTGRSVGDVSTDAFYREFFEVNYFTNSIFKNYAYQDKVLHSSTTPFLDENGEIVGAVCINYDITMIKQILKAFSWVDVREDQANPSAAEGHIPFILEKHLESCVERIGKIPAEMSREEKYQAVEYLESKGAFLITHSSVRVCDFLDITRYSLYAFLRDIRSKSEKP
jgi:predicted transcriptional regulator YheO